ncbi:integrin beta-4 isoform X1 [Gambusia affinis]|uniref:integrin beta-4 isoform X1 n=1 Tax=Gambusia affinis TaxID=33528 RepID=UPI001CDC366A|nr:integrin beta-4 isoform X1 [Gambusia affinis]XP_043958075.1 integrin beta-4 isoform X1 [Gambusia affinis]
MGSWSLRCLAGLGLLAVLLTCCSAQVNSCLAARSGSCSDCLQAGVGCAYCSEEDFGFPRCDLHEKILAHGCNAAYVIKATSQRTIEQNKAINMNLQRSQVSPQQVSMTFLPGETKELDVNVFAPTKGPLDLYILMDFSNSMKDDLDNLKKMGNKLATVVQEISSDYTIGFGKFVDKVIEPQTDMRPAKLKQPWPDSESPFSFKNVIPLTNNVDDFTTKLQKEKISGNLDAPEGGFDAILQAAVCKEIGWRDGSTHLLVFSTESAFHYEADGANVLAGILPRNDELCHLDENGVYVQATKQDYPSIPTLVRLLGKHNIIPIFAVTSYSFEYYSKLKEYFPIAEIGVLQEDSSNILDIMRVAFVSIQSKMSIRAENRPKAFGAQFLNTSNKVVNYGAFNFQPGEIGKFKVKLTAQQKVDEQPVCKADPEDKEGTIRVKPTTFSAAVNVKASVLCETCDCEKTPIPKAKRCNGNGKLVCGKCICDDGWAGAFCNCSKTSGLSKNQCIGPGMTESCSGRGDCQACGTCVCYNPDQYEGPYCQYDKTQCQRVAGILCNDRGSCVMGHCACSEGWEGPACECSKSNETCLDNKGNICGGRGKCVCGSCQCPDSGMSLTATCEPNFDFLLGACEKTRRCVQCQAWKTGEMKNKEDCDKCAFKVKMVDELKERGKVFDYCSFVDEDDCTYEYTVETSNDATNTELLVEVLKKKDCPAASLLWLLPLILFLLLLLALLLLCCWKYCACCASCWQRCLALLPCCSGGRMVGFKEDEYVFHQSQMNSNHLNTPLVRTGPPKGTDVVRWKVKDNVHRAVSHPRELMQPNPDEMIQFPISLRLNRLFSENLSRPESKDAEQLRQEVADNLNEVYKQIPEAQKVQRTLFRLQKNAGKRGDYTIMDTVLSAPRRAYPDIVKLTEKNVQSGNFGDLKVVPGYYTVATDREAAGAVEFQEGVESVDVHVPLFVKDDDDDKKQLKVEARDVPLGIAKIVKPFVNITIIKEHATSIFSFLQSKYTYSRKDGKAHIPINREIIEDGLTQVIYSTRDLTAKNEKDYMSVQRDLSFAPGETQKTVSVPLLEFSERDGLLGDKSNKQFVIDLSNPRQGAKLGQFPSTTVNIADVSESSVMMFKKDIHTFSPSEPTYSIPVVRSHNKDSLATVKWRTKAPVPQGFDRSGSLTFAPGETEKDIGIKPNAGSAQPETFQVELYDPSTKGVIGERRNTNVNITKEPRSPSVAKMQSKAFSSPRGNAPSRLLSPGNLKAKATGPRNIRLNWDPPPGNPVGYKVKYWIYGDHEKDVNVLDVKTPQADLTDLFPFCDYETQVCAYNLMGDGPDTDVVECKTLEDVPGEPSRLAFNVISPTVTQVSWGEPAEPNGDITAYELIYTPIDDEMKPVGAAKKVKIDNPKKRMLLIENLQSAQTYQYKVRAQNCVGWGPFRDATINLASQPTRPMSIPIIPEVPIVDAEAGEEYDSYLMYSNDVLKSPTSSKTPSVSGDDYMSNGRWDQSFHFPGGSTTRNLSASSSPMSTLSSNYKGGAGGSFTTEMHNTYMSGPGSPRRQDVIGGGGFLTTEVLMRKSSENRGYTDENIRDSIVIEDDKYPDLTPSGGFGYAGLQSSSQTQYSYGLSQSSRARTQSSEVNEALYSLDRVLHDARVSPGVPETPSRLVFSALGPTALKVSWQEPRCEKDILGYCVLYQLLNGGETKRLNVSNPAENSVVIHDLLPNHSYLFKVKAQSQEGWGPERDGVITIKSAVDPKSPLSPMPGSPFTLSSPSAPGPLVFTALSPDSLQLTWEKPRTPNGNILNYRVTCEQLHGGGDMRSFNVSSNAETSLTVPNLTKNVPYKFKVQAQTTQGFGPEREGIMTIESQDGGALSQHSSQSVTRRDVFLMPTEMTTRTNVSHTMVDDPYFSDGRMMTQLTETGSMVSRQVTREVVQRSVTGASTVTKRMFYES